MTPYPNNSYNNRGTLGFNHKPTQMQSAPRPPKPEDTIKDLPSFDIKTLTKELFDTTAETCARTIAESSDSINKPTQLRRFMMNWSCGTNAQAYRMKRFKMPCRSCI